MNKNIVKDEVLDDLTRAVKAEEKTPGEPVNGGGKRVHAVSGNRSSERHGAEAEATYQKKLGY